MEITIIKRGYNIEQVFIGKQTEQLEQWVKELNTNPINTEQYSIEETYTNKSIYDLVKFFEIE